MKIRDSFLMSTECNYFNFLSLVEVELMIRELPLNALISNYSLVLLGDNKQIHLPLSTSAWVSIFIHLTVPKQMKTANMDKIEPSKTLKLSSPETSYIQSTRSMSSIKKALVLLFILLIIAGCLLPSPFIPKGILDCCPLTESGAIIWMSH